MNKKISLWMSNRVNDYQRAIVITTLDLASHAAELLSREQTIIFAHDYGVARSDSLFDYN